MSLFTVDIEIKEEGGKNWVQSNTVVSKLLSKTLTADVNDYVGIERWYKNDIAYGTTNVNAQMVKEHKRRLVGLTNDDRVAELIEESIDITQRE